MWRSLAFVLMAAALWAAPQEPSEPWLARFQEAAQHQDANRLPEAKAAMEETLALAIQAGRHPVEIASLHDRIAGLHIETGEIEAARKSLTQARMLLKAHQAEGLRELGHHWMLCSILALEQRRYSLAIEAAQRALQYRQQVGAVPSDVAECHHQLGVAFQSARQPQQAAQSFIQAAEVCACPGVCYPALEASTAAALAIAQSDVAALKIAVQQLRAHSAPALVLLRPMNNLGILQARAKHLTEAEKTFREAREIARATIGPGHPLTAQIELGYAMVLDGLRRTKEARRVRAAAARLLREWEMQNHLNHTVEWSDLLPSDGS